MRKKQTWLLMALVVLMLAAFTPVEQGIQRFNTIITRALTVQNAATFQSTATFSGAANFDGATDFDSTVDFSGATVTGVSTSTLSSLTVTGASDLQGNIANSTGALTMTDNIMVDGAADAVQLTVSGYTTQTNNLLVIENSSGTDRLSVDNTGGVIVTGNAGTDLTNILTGSVKIGNGTPSVSQDGEDLYVEDQLEVDGEAQFDGAIDANGAMDIAGNITDADSAVTFGDNVAVTGAADAIQLTVTGFTTQTNSLLVLEASGGADKLTVSNDGNVDAAGGINYGSDDLYPLGYASSDQEVVCGTSDEFTGTLEIAPSGLSTVTIALASQITDPAASAAMLTVSDPTTSTFILYSWESDYTEGTSGITAHYCAVGDQ